MIEFFCFRNLLSLEKNNLTNIRPRYSDKPPKPPLDGLTQIAQKITFRRAGRAARGR